MDAIKQCRALGQASDPTFLGINATVNEACSEAMLGAIGILFASPALNNVSPILLHPNPYLPHMKRPI
jgi:hypothetical protein